MIKEFFKRNNASDFFIKIALYTVLQVFMPYVLYISGDEFSTFELSRMIEMFECIICALMLSVIFFIIIRYEERS